MSLCTQRKNSDESPYFVSVDGYILRFAVFDSIAAAAGMIDLRAMKKSQRMLPFASEWAAVYCSFLGYWIDLELLILWPS